MYNVVFSSFLILNHPFKNSTLKYVKEMFDQTSAKSVLIKKKFFFYPAGKETLEFVDSLILFANSLFWNLHMYLTSYALSNLEWFGFIKY